VCGITGTISRTPLTKEARARVTAMNNQMSHRGPDGAGDYNAPHLALAMRRLSIIDLTGGWQPLYNEDRSVVVIANGEIYNYVEQRAALETLGHRFNTNSDCETIAHLYEEHGDECVQHLRGMFAFALWDVDRQRLLLARDRMGEKPLYVWEGDGRVVFASEMKALLAGLPHTPDLDPVSIDQYFHFGYIPEPRTALQGVRKLPAGHTLAISLKPWRVRQRQYWDMAAAPALEGDPVEDLRAELDTISRLIVRSDVPVGVALSAGLDSSALAALAARAYPGTMHAFSIGYPGRPENDERAGAKALADHLGLPFHDIELATSNMVAAFPQVIRALDDPIADPASFGYYSVNRLAREHGVPVLLQGQGGDELFWGYPWVQQAAEDTLLKQRLYAGQMPTGEKLSRTLQSEWLPLPRDPSPDVWKNWLRTMLGRDDGHETRARWRRIADGYADTPVFMDSVVDFRQAQLRRGGYYGPAMQAQLELRSAYAPFTAPQPWNVPVLMTRLISQTYLLENGIAQGDRLSMASSVELRLPLVDYRLVEIVIGHRKTQPDLTQPPKAWLRAALRDALPNWVINRPKLGFSPPTLEWMRALIDAYGGELRDGALVQAGILSPEGAERAIRREGYKRGVLPMPFKALCLELWCKQMLSVPASKAESAV
jgi:asparagine synthase (glutamine-hydrolysing)